MVPHRKNVSFIKKEHPNGKSSKSDKKFISKPGRQLG
jgi:hypothetical protein